MEQNSQPLRALEVGSYADLANRPNPHDFAIQFVPSMAATLLSVEEKKGSPLTQTEVEAIRDGCSVVVSSPKAAKAVDDRRGYNDIDPKNCWQHWQKLRVELL